MQVLNKTISEQMDKLTEQSKKIVGLRKILLGNFDVLFNLV